MKKAIILVLFIVTLGFAQSPLPIQGISLGELAGFWYISFAFDISSDLGGSDCLYTNITVNNSDYGGEWNLITLNENQMVNEALTFNIVSSASNWIMSNNQILDWLAYDYLNGNWAIVGSGNRDFAYVLTKAPYINILLLNTQMLLLIQEGYQLNKGNTATYNGTCKSTNQMPIPLTNLPLSNLSHNWYVSYTYPWEDQSVENYTCITVQINFDSSTTGSLVETFVYHNTWPVGYNSTQYMFSISSYPAVWEVWEMNNDNGYNSEFLWLGYDFLNNEWATVATADRSQVFILTRIPGISPISLQNQIELLNQAGYQVNSNSGFIYSNITDMCA